MLGLAAQSTKAARNVGASLLAIVRWIATARHRGQARSYEATQIVGARLPAIKKPNSRLQPDRVPQRVFPKTARQSRAQGIGEHITRHRAQVFLGAHRMVVVTLLP